MIDDSEVLAGLAFLTRYAHPELRPALDFAAASCRQVMVCNAEERLRLRPTDDLELSMRALNGLASLGLKTVGDVERFFARPDAEILTEAETAPYYIGKKVLKEVREMLKNIGLEVRSATSAEARTLGLFDKGFRR